MEERLMWRWMWINKLTRFMGSCQKFIHLGFPNFSFRLNLWERIAKKWSQLYLIWSPNSGSRGWVKIWKCTFQLWGVHAGDGIVFQIQGTFRQFSIFFKAIGQKVPAIRNNCSFSHSDALWPQWLLLSPLYSLIIDQLFYVFQIFVEISPMDPPKQCNENLPPLPYHLAFWSCTDLVKFEIHVQRSDTSDYPNSTKFYLFLPTVKLEMHVQRSQPNIQTVLKWRRSDNEFMNTEKSFYFWKELEIMFHTKHQFRMKQMYRV